MIKVGGGDRTVYVNQYYTISDGTKSKHVFAGTTRVATRTRHGEGHALNHGTHEKVEAHLFYYHPDHLGSTGFVTDEKGRLYEHMEYFPFGETWVDEDGNGSKLPYLFTSKELDEETGLYYYGARYYDPRTSVWQSADPILAKYLPTIHNNKVSGLGGIYNTLNLAMYSYGHQNPIRFIDPDGNETIVIDPGHGANTGKVVDPGAVNGKLLEKDLALQFATKVGVNLAEMGHDVSYTRTGDVSTVQKKDLSWRSKVASDASADLFVSIHIDSHKGKSKFSALYYKGSAGESTISKNFAEGLINYLKKDSETSGLYTSMSAKGQGLGVLRDFLPNDTTPGVLLEIGNINDAKISDLVSNDALAKKVADSINNGIVKNRKK